MPKSFRNLIVKAILSSPERRMTLTEIYNWLLENAPARCPCDGPNSKSIRAWKNAIRRDLYIYRRNFKRVWIDAKNSYWIVSDALGHPEPPLNIERAWGMLLFCKIYLKRP